uniref:MRG-binding protein n=1 Tax=Strigamia maritima TaxID=126957 RepID=T1J096_STRMM
MAIKDKTAAEDLVDWNVEIEVQLFFAMRGHKPVGVNRHFQMACILNKFRHALRKDIGSQQIWDHLETMYDMSALHESEIVPFPNDELEFVLPEREFGLLLKKEEQKHNREQKQKESKEDREGKDEKEKETKEKSTTSSTPSEKKQKTPAANTQRTHQKDEQRNSIDSNDEKESAKSSKQSGSKSATKEKSRELKEVDSPKRKRPSRVSETKSGNQRDTPPNKRRRN